MTFTGNTSVGIVRDPTRENELTTHQSSGDAFPQSSQLAEPLWTDSWPGRVELVHAS